MVLASGFIARGKADCSQERGGGGRAVCLSPEDNEGELRRKESPTQFSQAPPPPSDERKEGFFTPFPSCFHCYIQFLSGMYKKELRPSNNPLTRLFAHMRSSFVEARMASPKKTRRKLVWRKLLQRKQRACFLLLRWCYTNELF